MVDAKFFDVLNYCICDAVNKYLGKEEATKLFRTMGKLHYSELRKRGMVNQDPDPIKTLENIVDYLEKSGYMGKITVTKTGDNELVVDMYDVSVLDSSIRLVDEGKSPSHIMTNTMFAALEELGYDAEIYDLFFDKNENHVREKWIVRRR